MLQLTCFVGRFRPSISLPSSLRLANQSITDFFRVGSMDDAGTPSINLRINANDRFDESITRAENPTTSFFLNAALARLAKNIQGSGVTDQLGLVLADRFEGHPNALGFMFDLGFTPPGEEGSGFFNAVPREGCAVFLDAIAAIRNTPEAFQKELVYTAIHELGHVFNLGHLETRPNFMASSSATQTAGIGSFHFEDQHRDLLHQAEHNPHVHPGGSKFENGFSPVNPFNLPSKRTGPTSKLKMQISIDQDEAFNFEPLELDIKITSTSAKTIQIPDEVDPGYDRFNIYITRPDGTRFTYRSPRKYCNSYSSINLSTKESFQRDVSIFGQSGGYTFTIPGEYEIQCFLQLGKDIFLASNVTRITIKKPVNTEKFRQAKKLLTNADAALLLYHRGGIFNKKVVAALEEKSQREKKTPIATNIAYALARFHSHRRVNYKAKKLDTILCYAEQALNSKYISEARSKNLLCLIEKLSQTV